jgi:hypothetical protein
MISYKSRISKNGVVYYIAVPRELDADIEIGDTVLVRLKKQGVDLGVFARRVARLGKRKIITLPHSFAKIWRILHGRTVDVELEKIEVKDIEEIVKKIIISLRPPSTWQY